MYCGAYWSADEGADTDPHDATHHTSTHHCSCAGTNSATNCSTDHGTNIEAHTHTHHATHHHSTHHHTYTCTYCDTHTTAQHDTYATSDSGPCGLCGCVVWMRCELHEAVQDQRGTARRWW